MSPRLAMNFSVSASIAGNANGYTEATAEAGTGSHRRRVAKPEAHLSNAAPKMFAAATEAVTSQVRDSARWRPLPECTPTWHPPLSDTHPYLTPTPT